MTTNTPTPPGFDMRAALREYADAAVSLAADMLAGRDATRAVARRAELAAQVVAEFERLQRIEALTIERVIHDMNMDGDGGY